MHINFHFVTLLWYCYLTYLSLQNLQPTVYILLIYLQQWISFSYVYFLHFIRFNNQNDQVNERNENHSFGVKLDEVDLVELNQEKLIDVHLFEEKKLKSSSLASVVSDEITFSSFPSKSSPSSFDATSYINQSKTSYTHRVPIPSKLNSFPFQDFTFQHERDLLFGSGFIPISNETESILNSFPRSTSYPHILSCWPSFSSCSFSMNHDVILPSKKVVLTLLPEFKAKEIQWMMDTILPYLIEQTWMPILKLQLLKEKLFYLCTPYFPINVSKFLAKRSKFKLNEAMCLTLFIVINVLQLEQMSMGFQSRFSFDYVFLKDEKKGITFDNLVLGGYHAITLLDPITTSMTTAIDPYFFRFLNALLSKIEQACERPFHFASWAFPLKQLHPSLLNSIHQVYQILHMLSVNLLLPISSSNA